jgi:hypothetical protein
LGRLDCLDVTHESITATRDGLNERRLRGIVAEGAAKDRYRMNQAVVGHGDVLPDVGDDLVSI